MDPLNNALGVPPNLQSKVRGLMLGLALGDAVGSRGSDVPPKGVLQSGGATQLAAWTAEGILRAYSKNQSVLRVPNDLMLRTYQRWAHLRGAKPKPGMKTWRPIPHPVILKEHGNGWLIDVPEMAEKRGSSPSTMAALTQGKPVKSQGCQHLLRTLPLAALSATQPGRHVVGPVPQPRTNEWGAMVADLARTLAGLTHDDGNENKVAEVAVRVLAGCLHSHYSPTMWVTEHIRALGGNGGEKLQQSLNAALENPADPRLLPEIAPDKTAMSALAGGVYVAMSFPDPDTVGEALEFAGWAPDGDSVAAVAGAMLGATHGYEALPSKLVSRLELGWVMDRLAIDTHTMLIGGYADVYGKGPNLSVLLGDPGWLKKYPRF